MGRGDRVPFPPSREPPPFVLKVYSRSRAALRPNFSRLGSPGKCPEADWQLCSVMSTADVQSGVESGRFK